MILQTLKRAAVYGAVALLMAGCGGGGDDGSAPPAGPVAGSEVGVLTDSAIQGVAYTTTSGVTGTTDAQGRYNYNPGDEVTFSIGALTIGQAAGSPLVTPLDLAEGSGPRLQNLLVVLQSLDSDGDASNGITIPAAAAEAMAEIDLDVALTAGGLASVKSAMAAGDISGEPRSAASAKAHFLEQAPALLASNVWVMREGGVPMIAVRVQDDGHFVLGEGGQADGSGGPGVEFGHLTATDVDANGFKLQVVTNVDTSGDWGLSHLNSGERVKVSGDVLSVYSEADDGSATFGKMENDPAGIVGAWVLADADGVAQPGRQMFLYFSDGNVMMVDPVGDQEVDSCGGAGVEIGKYSYNATTKVVTPSAPLYNTNGCAGLFESGVNPTVHTFTLAADGKTAIISGSDGGGSWQEKLIRVSR